MGYTRDLIVLANSIKESERCVAGKDLQTGRWVRPVATPEGAAIPRHRTVVASPAGNFPAKPLQIARIPFDTKAPLPRQPENELLAEGLWRLQGTFDRQRLDALVDTPESLWGRDTRRVTCGPMPSDSSDTPSLYLVQLPRIELVVENNWHGNKRLRAHFRYRSIPYAMTVTDPALSKLRIHPVGTWFTGENRYVTLSLGMPFHGYRYKIVAAIL